MKKVSSYALFAFQLILAGMANASDDRNSLQTCVDTQSKVSPEYALECYKQLAQELLEKSESKNKPISFKIARERGVAEEWRPSDDPIRVYKQNYLLFYSHSSQPNNAPTSPNANNQVPYSYKLDNKDIKFQISLKAHLLGEEKHALWFGYTQLSFWQAYDHSHSVPFRENNYEPELIYSYRPEHLGLGGLTASFLNAGLVHQSNGLTLPESRNWNRFYLQVGMEHDFGENGKFAMQPRWWKMLGGNAIHDDNPDIIHFLGRGEIEARYYYRQSVLTSIARIHSLQLDLAIPEPPLFGVLLHNANFHVQYFNGYGESLLDYNQRHHTFGLGISMPFE